MTVLTSVEKSCITLANRGNCIISLIDYGLDREEEEISRGINFRIMAEQFQT